MMKEVIYQDNLDVVRRNEAMKSSQMSQKKEVVDLPKS